MSSARLEPWGEIREERMLGTIYIYCNRFPEQEGVADIKCLNMLVVRVCNLNTFLWIMDTDMKALLCFIIDVWFYEMAMIKK